MENWTEYASFDAQRRSIEDAQSEEDCSDQVKQLESRVKSLKPLVKKKEK